ncbi:hypothetical protein EDD65_1203 [Keratinibaculum paraultunense]|jgi:hypothetical protein|uniref:Uncharacterized protein n=1 Tax=Keratinibaculum paraultunense TaxID=1278232 RepID=A0A4R3KN66_9FIRM|nr:hypothetical protein [Keratinibaculum paraultunense]QQY79064.1 hypothetical protein JL105_07670 [Keratinibaculum paraultunense]TCS85594.1 hypothetical protein EDD65_1203 [Keratinibaculum paraultunense]
MKNYNLVGPTFEDYSLDEMEASQNTPVEAQGVSVITLLTVISLVAGLTRGCENSRANACE